jgi:DNA-binding MarR family transcriptional regulator
MSRPRVPTSAASRTKNPVISGASEPRDDPAYRTRLDAAKRASTLQLLFRAARLLDEEAVRRLAAVEGAPRLRRSHTALLPHIDLEGTRISDLAERLGVSKQAVSELVDDLEAVGVVARAPDPDDARARRVSFTAKGRKGLLDGLSVLRSLEQELARTVTEKTMTELHEALVRVLLHVEAHAASAARSRKT